MVSQEECQERAKVINCDDVIGGLWSPDDGQINPVDATMVMAAAARKHGATIMEETAVTKIITKDGKVCGVETNKGTVECEKVLLCGGTLQKERKRILSFFSFFETQERIRMTAGTPRPEGYARCQFTLEVALYYCVHADNCAQL